MQTWRSTECNTHQSPSHRYEFSVHRFESCGRGRDSSCSSPARLLQASRSRQLTAKRCCALSADAVELTGLEQRERLQDGWDEWREMHQYDWIAPVQAGRRPTLLRGSAGTRYPDPS